MSVLNKLVNWYFSKKAMPYWCILVIDCAMVMFSGYVGVYLERGGQIFSDNFWHITWSLLLCLVLFLVSFRVFHTYSGIIRYSSFVDLQRVIFAAMAGTVASWVLSLALKGNANLLFPGNLGFLISFAIATLLMCFTRVTVKQLFDTFRESSNTVKVFIYGISDGGVGIAKNIRNQTPMKYALAGFVSPFGDVESNYLMGVKIRRDGPNLVRHMLDAGACALIVSPMQIDHFRERNELIDSLIANNIKILLMPNAEEWDGKSDLTHMLLHEVEIEDLLPRDKIEVNMDAIGDLLRGRHVLITGAAGSIGSEMVRQIAPFAPAEMTLIDQAETPMHDVRIYLAANFPEIKAETIVTTITDREQMENIFSTYRPDYVFHAAAYKHVPMMEDNPAQAVRNNVEGTRIIADLAVKYGTKKFVMISTDKAVNPTNVMGCSKRICEIYCQSLGKAIADGRVKGVTQFVTTRFGNVLGSNGSVIPLFREQIKKGGPVTVTHPDIIRYFMLIPEACKLVLEAGTMGKGGEIFVFDMGKPVRIVDLAKRMIALSGARNIEIKFTGLRDGEKLYEEVLSDMEKTRTTSHPKIMVASVREYDYETACRNEDRLMEVSRTFDDMQIVKVMKEIVPEYKSQSSKYTVLD